VRSLLGIHGENEVTRYLQDQGFTILERNYKKFFGEIDIIARKESLITFVEVKARRNTLVSMHSLVLRSKQLKIMQCAQWFMASNNYAEVTYRFDVALVFAGEKKSEISYIPNAFGQDF
jgi:putative endonuclease